MSKWLDDKNQEIHQHLVTALFEAIPPLTLAKETLARSNSSLNLQGQRIMITDLLGMLGERLL